MSWIIVAFAAYFLLAIANLVDKYLVEKVVGSARAYTFVACVLGAVVFVAAPWVLEWPGWQGLLYNVILGGIFAAALLLLFASLRRGEASRALVVIGGSTPVFTIPLAFLILGDRIPSGELMAIGFLIAGVAVVALLPSQKPSLWSKIVGMVKKRPSTKTSIALALASGLAYSLFFVGSKYVYQDQSFLSAFLWMRLGAAMFASLLLISPRAQQEVKALFTRKPGSKRNQGLVVGNQVLGALGFILQNYAVFLGPVALVNALQGVQYAWIIVLGALVTVFRPDILKEDISWRALTQKGLAILLIGIGLYLLAV
ncbi:MAG: EamA family transporter [bacterium]|nr:EamA family transporter [bacterium]